MCKASVGAWEQDGTEMLHTWPQNYSTLDGGQHQLAEYQLQWTSIRSLSSADCRLCYSRSASLLKPSAAPALEFSRWDHFLQIPLERFIAAFFFFFKPTPSFKSLNYYSTLQISPGLYSVSSCSARACSPFNLSSLQLQLEKCSFKNMLRTLLA